MRRFYIFLLLATLICGLANAEDSPRLTFYVELIRGSDVTTPPIPNARLIGPKLSARLHPIFKWKNYWEIKRDSVTLKTGEKVRKRLSDEREVEIELLNSKEIAIRTYSNGKPVCDSRQSLQNRFFISGGDKEGGQAWFIVVRRTPPPVKKPAKT